MLDNKTKTRIFAEYLDQKATNGIKIKVIRFSNIEQLVNENYKIILKSVYDLSKEEMFEIAEEVRYNRGLRELFRDFEKDQFRMSSESRNKTNLQTAMISYVYRDSNDGNLKGDWFRLVNVMGVEELKLKGYDIGSPHAYIMQGDFKKRMSLEELNLAIIK